VGVREFVGVRVDQSIGIFGQSIGYQSIGIDQSQSIGIDWTYTF